MATLFHCLSILALPIKCIPKLLMPRFLTPSVASTNPATVADCVVCLSEIGEDEEMNKELRCKHVFHKGCLDRWVKHQGRTCPLCRDQLLLQGKKIEAKAAAEGEFEAWGGETSIVFSPFSGCNLEDYWWIR